MTTKTCESLEYVYQTLQDELSRGERAVYRRKVETMMVSKVFVSRVEKHINEFCDQQLFLSIPRFLGAVLRIFESDVVYFYFCILVYSRLPSNLQPFYVPLFSAISTVLSALVLFNTVAFSLAHLSNLSP